MVRRQVVAGCAAFSGADYDGVLPFVGPGDSINGMKRLVQVLSFGLLTFCINAFAQSAAAVAPSLATGLTLNVELLSDTNGTNLDGYMRKLASEIKAHWTAPAPGDGAASEQEADIRFTLAPDGKLLAMRLEGPKHNLPLDKAAWAATKDAVYAPLPVELKDGKLEVRVHFLVK